LTDAQRREANGGAKGPARSARSEFARKAAEIGRGITGTMGKLERLAQRSFRVQSMWRVSLTPAVAKRKTLFDDKPVEIAELTFVIKQDLASLNSQISSLQALTKAQHPQTRNSDQEGEHNKNVWKAPACVRLC